MTCQAGLRARSELVDAWGLHLCGLARGHRGPHQCRGCEQEWREMVDRPDKHLISRHPIRVAS